MVPAIPSSSESCVTPGFLLLSVRRTPGDRSVRVRRKQSSRSAIAMAGPDPLEDEIDDVETGCDRKRKIVTFYISWWTEYTSLI